MITDFHQHLLARRRSINTIKIRLVYVRQLADRHDLATVTLADMDALLASHPEWKPETMNAAIASWRVFYRWAHRAGKIAADPTEWLERVPVPRTPQALADDNVIRIALGRAAQREQAMLLLGRECGLRRNEIATLRVANREGDWLTVTGKGNRTRRLHIGAVLRAALERLEHPQLSPFYFPGTMDGHVTPKRVGLSVMQLIGTSTHSMRRRAITNLWADTGDLHLAQVFAGHANPNTTAGYIYVSDNDMLRAGTHTQLAAA